MTEDAVREQVFAIVARTFAVPVADLADDTTADDVDGWDSLAHATLLIRIEKAFNVDVQQGGGDAQDLGALVRLVLDRTAVSPA